MFDLTDPDPGEPTHPAMELVRLAVPRRVYTETHLAFVADSCVKMMELGKRLRGLRIVEQAPVLRHFTARLEPVAGSLIVD
jgi:tryptophanase